VTSGGTTTEYPLWGRTAAAVAPGVPFGLVESPAQNATVAGELPFTGWALDDSGIASVGVYRGRVGAEPVQPNGLVFLGTATIVEGARPDVAAAYPSYPGATRAGWGLMILSNMLPNSGNGTFTIYAYATSVAGEVQLLGSRVINAANAASAKPFGTIDTPAQGATVSGIMTNFGWALTPQPNAIPKDGSTIDVYIDNIWRGHPVYDNNRPDIATLFPGLKNSNGAVGYFVFDTTTLINGVHSIAWVIRDDAGNAQGVGSRYFTVENDTFSAATAMLRTLSETGFNPAGQPVVIDIIGAAVSSVDDVAAFRNGLPVARGSIQLSGGTAVTLNGVLTEGRNDVVLFATDVSKHTVYAEYTLWAGSRTLTGTLKDELGLVVSGATVQLQLGDDTSVGTSVTTTVAGSFSVPNVPNRTIFVTARGTQNRLAWVTTVGAAGAITLNLKAIGTPSAIDNNDFSLGLSGWNTGTAPVALVTHVEAPLTAADIAAGAATDVAAAAATVNSDLKVTTSGIGPQTVVRTFTSKPGTKTVTVRFKFVTSEFPGGYFGTEYNDSFAVTIASKTAGGIVIDTQSMNGLGRGAFTADGATKWREVTLPVAEAGDTVEATMRVTNVGDGQYDSYMLVDGLGERKITITSQSLLDIDDKKLDLLSADPSIPDTYQEGYTQVHGTVSIEGPATDALQSLTLEIGQYGRIAAIAELAPEARAALLKPFGTAKRVQITTMQRLFRLSKAEAAKVNGSVDSTLTLTLRARSAAGEEVVAEIKSLPLLVRYTGTNRYPAVGRDEDLGGDDWARPSLRDLANHYSSTMTGGLWGDFSNMNGGNFYPPHHSHAKGIDADGYFTGYNARDKTVAETMIKLLNDATYGSQITQVWVAYEKVPTNTFWTAIKDVTLADGRAASGVILKEASHTTHFHWRIEPE
jgi:hypothetical protein